jgi:predicted RNase H-like HicB family nuclease
MRREKVVVEQHPEGYVAYPLGVKGAVVGEGETAEAAVADAESAIRFAVETIGKDAFDDEFPLLDACMTEVSVPSDAQIPR